MSGTVTFLFTDIEGSTRLWEPYPEVVQKALARHPFVDAPSPPRYNGLYVYPHRRLDLSDRKRLSRDSYSPRPKRNHEVQAMADKLATVDESGVVASEHSVLELDGDGEWAVKDRRRGELIDKKHTVGLEVHEQQELDRLQAEMEQRLDAIAPVSFEVVEAMEEVIRAIKAGQSKEQNEPREP